LSSIVSLSKQLSHKLLTLDIDEGIRIESTKNRKKKKKMYINKRTSGCFVLEITYSDSTDMTEIRFCSDIKYIHKLIENIFGNEYSVTIY
jgi:plasmid rolling circle replication initiator protein Rep